MQTYPNYQQGLGCTCWDALQSHDFVCPSYPYTLQFTPVSQLRCTQSSNCRRTLHPVVRYSVQPSGQLVDSFNCHSIRSETTLSPLILHPGVTHKANLHQNPILDRNHTKSHTKITEGTTFLSQLFFKISSLQKYFTLRQ